MATHSHAGRVFLAFVIVVTIVSTIPLFAQDGKLQIHVRPQQAYAFVDGHAVGEANRTLSLSAGNHKIELYNYGFKTAVRNVTILSGKTETLDVTLEEVPATVSGPWGCITIEGAQRDAILLNGKTPEFFVGHGDEFNHEWWWKQELIVPPGTHQLTVLRSGSEVWSGPVVVPANQRVVLDVPKGVRKTVAWPRGEELSALSRFKAGSASATVAVAKPVAQLSTQTAQINCGESIPLKWSTTDASAVEIIGVGPVAASGEQVVQPNQTTTYELRATGPGGTAISSTTVDLSNAIQAQLAVSQPEVRYKKVGDKLIEVPNAALNWSVSNANNIAIEPLGSVEASGTRPLQAVPRKTDFGPVDETVTYKLTATNPCGGTETRTATLHIVGSIEPETQVAMHSIYFPTDLPKGRRVQASLVPSQRDQLKLVADSIKAHLANKPDDRFLLAGNADTRGAKGYNMALSERRAQVVRDFLIEQGIPAANIETKAFGEDRNLTPDEVKLLIEQVPDASEDARQKAIHKLSTMTLAHNRRVDITISATGQESARHYPLSATDFAELARRGGATRKM